LTFARSGFHGQGRGRDSAMGDRFAGCCGMGKKICIDELNKFLEFGLKWVDKGLSP
jgi:hypothetical protein